jgi:membrane-associated protease RseP (regulator of RpoE activity)
MRNSILLSAIALFGFGAAAYAAECPVHPANGWSGGGYTVMLATDTAYPGEEESTGSYLGVDITDITPERVSALKLKDERGVEITMVDQDAPAGKGGLKEHDVILTMNGTNVESGAQLRRMIRETPPGRVVTFGVSRDGQPLALKVQLADRHKTAAYAHHSKDFKFEMPPMPSLPDFDLPVSVVVVHSSMRSGLMVENITPQLGEFFGVKNGKGVLVRSVEKGSRAEKSGFRAGDVIVRVNDQTVHDTSDFTHALRSTSGGAVAVGIVRDKKEQTLTLSLPEQKSSGEIFDEALDAPEIDARARIDLSEMRDEMAQVQPQVQFALRQSRNAMESVRPEIERAQREAREEVERLRPQIERAEREARAAGEEAQRELCSRRKALQEQVHQFQRQLEKRRDEILKENRRQLERLRHEMRGDWMQI